MQLAIQICNYLIALPLELLIVAALLRGAYRRYPVIFAYMIAYFLTTVVETPVNIASYERIQGARRLYVQLYWVDETILQVLVFAVVLSLLYEATARVDSRRILRMGLMGAAAIFAGVSFFLHYKPDAPLSGWMTLWARDLSFCAIFLDLALWFLLIASRKKDHLLLLLSGALGIQFTGEAMGQALRGLAGRGPLVISGDIMLMLADFVCLYIWWQAFRGAARAHQRLQTAVERT